MGARAKDIMATEFPTICATARLVEAIELIRSAGSKGRRVFGLMVVDESKKLVGMISMYDILLFLRPKHIHIWGNMEDIDVDGVIAEACRSIASVQVGDLMSSEVVTIGPDAHIMMVLDVMIKKHIRRLPVAQDDEILGIVYISDLFNHLLGRLSEPEIFA